MCQSLTQLVLTAMSEKHLRKKRSSYVAEGPPQDFPLRIMNVHEICWGWGLWQTYRLGRNAPQPVVCEYI